MMLPSETTRESVWIASTPTTSFPRVENDLKTEILVVGGGLVGLTTAVQLQEEGKEVLLVDRWSIGTKVSGNTTAKITAFHDLNYQSLIKVVGEEDARKYYESNQQGIDLAETMVMHTGIPCDFSRRDLCYFSRTPEGAKAIEAEHEAVQRLRIPGEMTKEIDFPGDLTAGLRFTHQAQFHPRKFMLGLAERFTRNGGRIYEHSLATKVKPGADIEVTVNDNTIQPDILVIASHYPFYEGSGMYNTRLFPRSAYGVAVQLQEPYSGAMYVGADEHEHTFRSQPSNRGELVIVGGEDHSMGGDNEDRYGTMITDVTTHFPVTRVDNVWSAHDFNTLDSMPYIGRLSPLHDRIYVATGFAEWGMAKSFLSAQILTDLIMDKENDWASLYNPARVSRAMIPQTLHKVKSVATFMIKPKFQKSDESEQAVSPGTGKVLDLNKEKTAVYCSPEGRLEEVSAVCSHMGCIVGYSASEQKWDCPCHGSQYQVDGEVVYGPAFHGLKKVKGSG